MILTVPILVTIQDLYKLREQDNILMFPSTHHATAIVNLMLVFYPLLFTSSGGICIASKAILEKHH